MMIFVFMDRVRDLSINSEVSLSPVFKESVERFLTCPNHCPRNFKS
jgi:hypothetical protein